ncbi:hypothetical protein N7474_008579 [Penicillium riverlandense]|uniref:uncharacterized protein n=1 Tax=Penicillium riverlandense TaxID=1903569 RepID=UPI002547E389|nr:uncharacterized protein N7474_008579 [Penicillium riverlandense]KAJ5812278.1 hypothetical protein N7474_008579 [Penicillium riverlandense]
MIAVNLDDIIHYHPPASKHHFTPPQASGFVPHYPSPSASDTFPLTHQVPPYLTQSIFPSSVHSRGLQDHAQNLQFVTSHSSGETQYSPFNTGLPKQSAIENSNEFDKELLNPDTARKDSLVKSDIYWMDGKAQNGSVDDFWDDAEDALLEPSLQPIFEDLALWEDISDSSPAVRFYSSAECPGSMP